MTTTLIANSGIQILRFEIKFNFDSANKYLNSKAFFINALIGNSEGTDTIGYAYKKPESEDFYIKQAFGINNCSVDEFSGTIKTPIGTNGLPKDFSDVEWSTSLFPPLETYPDAGENIDSGFYYYELKKERDLKKVLLKYENTWLPIPFYKQINGESIEGPYAWGRMLLRKKDEESALVWNYEVILAFDTTTTNDETDSYSPFLRDGSSEKLSLCMNEDLCLNFVTPQTGFVKEYLEMIDKKSNEGLNPNEKSKIKKLEYIAGYLYLLKYLGYQRKFYEQEIEKQKNELENITDPRKRNDIASKIENFELLAQKNTLPQIELLHENIGRPIDVDLVLDIGNANTCGLLFEAPENNFTFKSVKKLELKDLSDKIGEVYNEPFSMRLTFAKAQFGDINIPSYPKVFRWASLVRVGNEAQRLINKCVLKPETFETAITNSSPKRYLWDNNKTDVSWVFANTKGLVPAYFDGISNQFSSDGDFLYSPNIKYDTVRIQYSRKSLMTFVFIELFQQALSQINSPEFREGANPGRPRKLKRVTITCPTSIVQEEQVILRQCAIEAALAIKRYQHEQTEEVITPSFKPDFEILPSPTELKKTIEQAKEGQKKDWIYDEATCTQLLFLYSEIKEKYKNDQAKFFGHYGKIRSDVNNSYQNSLTIASLDIGGGTTDLMILAHEYASNQNSTTIIPTPLFWESFINAGDNVVEEIIKQIIIEGELAHGNDDPEYGCKGVIYNYAKGKGCKDIQNKIRKIFGVYRSEDFETEDTQTAYLKSIYRKNITVQILIPIALKYLQHANSSIADYPEISFNDFFSQDSKPNNDLIKYINVCFGNGFNFLEIKWKLSRERVNIIIEDLFADRFKQIAILLDKYGADLLLLSGKITEIPKVKEMFRKYFPVPPNRILALNSKTNFLIDWYPIFDTKEGHDEYGPTLNDTKTVVAMGAIIALMGGALQRLEDFKVDTSNLIKYLTPTVDYLGGIKENTIKNQLIYLTPNRSQYTLRGIHPPIKLGYKRFEAIEYPARPIYILDFDYHYLEEKSLELDTDLDTIKREILSKSPFTFEISRDITLSKEKLKFETIEDKDGNQGKQGISYKKVFIFKLMTLPESKGHWADTGEFVGLRINN
jgi:hypothetical protein